MWWWAATHQQIKAFGETARHSRRFGQRDWLEDNASKQHKWLVSVPDYGYEVKSSLTVMGNCGVSATARGHKAQVKNWRLRSICVQPKLNFYANDNQQPQWTTGASEDKQCMSLWRVVRALYFQVVDKDTQKWRAAEVAAREYRTSLKYNDDFLFSVCGEENATASSNVWLLNLKRRNTTCLKEYIKNYKCNGQPIHKYS